MSCTSRSSSLFFACAVAAAGCSAPPTDAPDLAGGPDVWEGTLRVVIRDPREGSSTAAEYLELPDGLYVPIDRQVAGLMHVEGGQRVRLLGGLSGRRLAANDMERVGVSSRSEDIAQAVLPGGTGPTQKIAVILVSLQGVTNAFDPDQVRTSLFGASGRSSRTYWEETSFGKFTVTGAVRTDGDVFGPYTISGDCSYDNIVNASAQAAQNAGVDLSVYDHVVRYTPQNVCDGGGEGDQPGKNAIIYGLTLNYLWEYVAHEVGHNFGCGHASSYDNCAVGAFEGSCAHNEYGDETDVMGSRNGQYMSYYKDALGWLNAANKTVVTSSRQVRLYPIEQAAAGLQSVLVPRGDDSQFHLEFRQAVGYDSFLETNLTNGVLLRYLPSGRRTLPHIIDFGSSAGAQDAALRPGTTFTDQNRQIKVLDVTSASALVEIVIDGKPAGGEGGLGGAGAGGGGGTGTGGAGNGGASGGGRSGGAGGAGGAAGVGGVVGAGGAAGSGGRAQAGASGVAGATSGSAGSGGRTDIGGSGGAGSGGAGAGFGSGSASGAGAGASPAAGGAGSGGVGASGARAGSGATATGGSPVAVVPVQTTDGEETGCGCRVAGDANRGGGAPASVAVVATLLAFVRRRGRA